MNQRFLKIIAGIALFIGVVYGTSRLYFWITDGFREANIFTELPNRSEWEVASLDSHQLESLRKELSQPFTYLGKGCQSYVFQSQDGQYVIKFIKFQRFTPQAWLDYFEFIAPIDKLRLAKIEKKRRKLSMFLDSWKMAFEELRHESGLIMVHINRSNDLNMTIEAIDKIGLKHSINLDQLPFLIQRKGELLCNALDRIVAEKGVKAGQELIDRLIDLILSEYDRGLADNDHALMQNTGVVDGQPVHIDVGQFLHHPTIHEPEVWKLHLFSKTFKFQNWLDEYHPELGRQLYVRLSQLIGPEIDSMVPHLRNHAWSE